MVSFSFVQVRLHMQVLLPARAVRTGPTDLMSSLSTGFLAFLRGGRVRWHRTNKKKKMSQERSVISYNSCISLYVYIIYSMQHVLTVDLVTSNFRNV